ncbi:hypothetical protein EG328_007843 [Venturia inaequalis]|uniref:pectinesterase n=1 Tax=Venturia inaequalis TaxID=5025 RepID=A0A8H3YP77_VENIN|nr:hypothetical protein EG328_007843 [Venturia inaequalis]
MRFSATLTSLFASSVLAITTPPKGALVVGTSSAAKYKTVQAAVTAASSGATIFIEVGTYKEQVFVPAAKKNLKIIGYSSTDASYEGNKVTIVQGQAQDSQSKPNNDMTATLRAYGDGMKVYNVNLVNSRGVGSQALALSAFGDQLGFYGCQLTGNQDTVMSQKGKHYFAKSLIAGNTDFIFGQNGVLWIDQCVIQCVKANTGYITANGRADASNPSYYVINNSTINGPSAPGTFYLGRPWREYSRVMFQSCDLSSVINPAGWSIWGKSEPKTDHVTYLEYKNTGEGAATGKRVAFGKQATAPVAIGTLFPSTSWIDPAFFYSASNK